MGFERSEAFSGAVDLLVRMQEIEPLRGGWLVFDDQLDTTTAQWCLGEDEALWTRTGTIRPRVPDDDGRAEAIGNLTGALTHTLEEAQHMVAGLPGDLTQRYVETAKLCEAHLFGGCRVDTATS